MSTVLLSVLVGSGLLVLLAIAYSAHRIEMGKIERARKASIHRDRFRNLSFIVETLPSQALKDKLPLLLTKNMVLHLRQALELDPTNNDLKQNLAHNLKLHESIARGGSLPNQVAGGNIGEQLKNVQRGLKLLKEFILQQHKTGSLTKAGATEYIRSLHDVNLTATLEGLMGQANHSKREGNISLAIRYYQLALNEIKKSKRSANFVDQMKEIAENIKELKAKRRIKEVSDQADNKKLAESISTKNDDKGSFEMKQIN